MRKYCILEKMAQIILTMAWQCYFFDHSIQGQNFHNTYQEYNFRNDFIPLFGAKLSRALRPPPYCGIPSSSFQ